MFVLFLQETEFAVQSIVLDDNRSQHSAEDTATDYLNEGAGSRNSRHDSLNDTAALVNMNLNTNNQEQGNSSQDNIDAGNDGSITSKLSANAEHQVMYKLKQHMQRYRVAFLLFRN